MAKTAVLVVGPTGMLGAKIVDALLRTGRAEVRALLRPGKGEEWDRLRSKGVAPVEGDLTDPTSLAKACEGVKAVVSALGNDPSVFVEGQLALADAAARAGAGRFIPSDFSADFHGVDYGDNDNMDLRKRLHERLEGHPVPITTIHNGMFIEGLFGPWSFQFDPAAGTFSYWGDGDQNCDYTATDDVAAFTAEAALDPNAPRELKIAGDVISQKGIIAAYGRATGRRLEGKRMGSADDLRALIDEKKKGAKSVMDYLLLQYHWTMITGKAKLDTLDNARYPGVRAKTVEQFLRDNPAAIKT